MDCAVRAGCPYDAVRYYLESGRTSVRAGRVHWPINVLDPHPTPENIEQALRTGPPTAAAFITATTTLWTTRW